MSSFNHSPDTYPAKYVTASSDEVLELHKLVNELGGVVSLLSFRLTEDNALEFAQSASGQLAQEVGLDAEEFIPAFHKVTLMDVAESKFGVVLHGPDSAQLQELARTAELMVIISSD